MSQSKCRWCNQYYDSYDSEANDDSNFCSTAHEVEYLKNLGSPPKSSVASDIAGFILMSIIASPFIYGFFWHFLPAVEKQNEKLNYPSPKTSPAKNSKSIQSKFLRNNESEFADETS